MNYILLGIGIVILIIVIVLIICVTTGIPLVPPIKTLPKVRPTNIKPDQVEFYVVATSDIGHYADHSININQDYAKKHGYRFKVFTQNATPDLPINFGKIQNALDILEGPQAPKYVIHIDADAVIVKPNYPITSIIDSYMGSSSMLIGEDCYDKTICSKPGRINSGVFIVKNDDYGKKILKSWLEGARGRCSKYTTQFPNCQLVFWHCIMMSKLRFHIKVAPYNLLNGKDGLFIQHMMQHTTNERIEHFKKVREYNHKWEPGIRMKVF